MEKLVNGYSVLDLDLYRKMITAEACQLACAAEDIGLENVACYWDEKAELYRKMTDEEIADRLDIAVLTGKEMPKND